MEETEEIKLKPGVKYKFILEDVASDKTLEGLLLFEQEMIYLGFKGFGDLFADYPEGYPVGVEYYEGKLRVILWDDINKEDYTKEIDLSGALISNREDDSDTPDDDPGFDPRFLF